MLLLFCFNTFSYFSAAIYTFLLCFPADILDFQRRFLSPDLIYNILYQNIHAGLFSFPYLLANNLYRQHTFSLKISRSFTTSSLFIVFSKSEVLSLYNIVIKVNVFFTVPRFLLTFFLWLFHGLFVPSCYWIVFRMLLFIF